MKHDTEKIIKLIKESSEEIHINIRSNLETVPFEERKAWMMGWENAHNQLKQVFLAETELSNSKKKTRVTVHSPIGVLVADLIEEKNSVDQKIKSMIIDDLCGMIYIGKLIIPIETAKQSIFTVTEL